MQKNLVIDQDLKYLDKAKISQDEKMAQVATAPKFGYEALDNMIPGLLPGQLTVLAGGTSMGKTTFLANVTYNIAYKQNKTVFFASLESGDSITNPILNLSNGAVSENILVYSPKTNTTLEKLEKTVFDNLHCAETLIIDHIHYLSSSTNKNYSAHIGELTRKIQMMAVRLHIPIILVAHVRKMKSETQIPSLHDLKDSSALYQDPSTVIIIHRFKNESDDLVLDQTLQKFKNTGLLLIEKNRDFGNTGGLTLEFDPKLLKFSIGGQWT